MKKIVYMAIFIISAFFSYFLGISAGKKTNKESAVLFNDVVVLEDTSYYTGKDVCEYAYSPIRVVNTGIIPDAKTASKIAYEYISVVYGKRIAEEEQPYNIQLINNQIWRISGSISQNKLGGVFSITIEKQTGKIWSICHTK